MFTKEIKEKIHNILLSAFTLLIFLLPGINLMASLVFVNDKEAHLSFFLVLALYRMINVQNYGKIVLTNILLGILIEFCQMPLPGRSFDVNDVVADAIGTLFGYFFRVGFDKMPLSFMNVRLSIAD